MSLDKTIPEMRELLSWLGNPPRNPAQTHRVNESDCEVVKLPNGDYLASTTDSVSEEILAKFYRDPYTMGWVTAMASLSDLAAVGGSPIGMLLSAQWSPSADEAFKSEVARGFSDALRASGTYWLGGDSGIAASTVLTGVAIGSCRKAPLSRIGIESGDILCLTGKPGTGPAMAMRYLREESDEAFPERAYRPKACLHAGSTLLNEGLAKVAMDTSDGILSTLHTLSVLNQTQFELFWDAGNLDPLARAYCEARDIPLWMLWTAEHGDFQLITSIARDQLPRARTLLPDLLPIGKAVSAPKSCVRLSHGISIPIDLGYSRSFLSESKDRLPKALIELSEMARKQELP